MVIEQRYSFGLKPTLLVFLSKVVVVHFEVESVSFLIEFGSFFMVDFFVVESKFIVFEFRNFLICVKINWGLIAPDLGDKVLVF